MTLRPVLLVLLQFELHQGFVRTVVGLGVSHPGGIRSRVCADVIICESH